MIVRLFARFREIAGKNSFKVKSKEELLKELEKLGIRKDEAIFAVNMEIVDIDEVKLDEEDEIAVMPPFNGG